MVALALDRTALAAPTSARPETAGRGTVRALPPDVIVSAAPHRRQAESEPDVRAALNAAAPGVASAEAAAGLGASAGPLPAPTTSLDGSRHRPWRGPTPTGPLGSVYGRTKLEGEQTGRASDCAKHLRSCAPAGSMGARRHPAKTMLRLATRAR